MATHKFKEKTIESFLSERKIHISSGNISGTWVINDGIGLVSKPSNKHLHEKLTPELLIRKGSGNDFLIGDIVTFELSDKLEGTEQTREVEYEYTIEAYDSYAFLLKRDEPTIN